MDNLGQHKAAQDSSNTVVVKFILSMIEYIEHAGRVKI